MTPKEIEEHFSNDSATFSHYCTVQSNRIATGLADDGVETFARFLAATMWHTAPQMMNNVDVPDLGQGDNEIELMAAWLHWKQSVEEGKFGPLSLMRKGSYMASDEKNIERAKKFWTLADLVGAVKVPVDPNSKGFMPWLGTMDVCDIDEPIRVFRQAGINKEGKFPVETTLKNWDDPKLMTLETHITLPDFFKSLPAFDGFDPKESRVYIASTAETNMETLSINIKGGSFVDVTFSTPRGLAIALHDIVVDQQYTETKICFEEGNETAQAVIDYMLSAITIHDRKAPKWDGTTLKREKPTKITPAIFIGLAEATLEGETLAPKRPAPKKFQVNLSKEEALTLNQYLKSGNINKRENVPDGVRLPGV